MRALAASAAVLLVLVAVLGLLVDHAPLPIDQGIAAAVIPVFPAPATQLFDLLATLPVIAVLAVVAAVACWLQGRGPMAAAFLLGLCAEAAVTLVKVIVDRPRPPGAEHVGDFVTYASYPSGHTVRAVAMAGLLVVAFAPRTGAIRWIAIGAAAAAAAFVGLARIAAGEHWPTDVVGGALLGGAWLCLALIVRDLLAARRR